jgi:carboxymethylenebutenolidase
MNLTLETRDGPMRCFEATPAGEPRGGIVVIQEAFGVNDYIQDVAGRLADAGYRAIAPELFHRAGGGTAGYDEFDKVLALFEGVDDDGILVDVDAALDHLRGTGLYDRALGIVGFCFGGRVSFLVAVRRAIGAAVGFYGGGIVRQGHFPFPPLIGEASQLQTPWLGLFGDEDASIPVEDVEQLRAALVDAPVDTEIVRYAGADHGFHAEPRADRYHPEAAADAWSRTLVWFEEHLRRD